ncbi:MAG: tripartite tricarboxylate transporter TctB family protein [Sphaerochaetaceae bacterium]|nr:tripartite tricarboxylate transporter TctB family protein [Sphaerochaetaceae bacterium]
MDDEEIKDVVGEEKQRPIGHLDFITAIILFVMSVATIITSIGYWREQKIDFYASAGFLPIIIAGVLLVLSVILFFNSLKESSLKQRNIEIKDAFIRTIKSKNFHRAIIGLLICIIYVYFLLGKYLFWFATFVGLAALLIFNCREYKLKNIIKAIIIAALGDVLIIVIFQYVFNVPMP